EAGFHEMGKAFVRKDSSRTSSRRCEIRLPPTRPRRRNNTSSQCLLFLMPYTTPAGFLHLFPLYGSRAGRTSGPGRSRADAFESPSVEKSPFSSAGRVPFRFRRGAGHAQGFPQARQVEQRLHGRRLDVPKGGAVLSASAFFQAGHRLVQPPGGAKRQRLRLACENGIRFEGLCRLPPPADGILKPLPVLFRRRAALLQERKGQTSQLPRQISAPFKKILQSLRETAGRQDQGR